MNTALKFFYCFFISISAFSQNNSSKKEIRIYHKVFSQAIDSFLHSKPSQFVLISNTDNREIQKFNFSEYVTYLRAIKNSNFDSSWFTFLKAADKEKSDLSSINIKQIKSAHTIRLMNRDSLLKIQQRNNLVGRGTIEPFGWIDGWMTISTPIISKDKHKAIVEISYIRDDKDGAGGILLLEKRDHKWVVIQLFETWVS